MKTISIGIPDELEMDEQELRIQLAARLYQVGRLSLGRAADMANLTKRTFAELLGRYGVSLFNYPASDLASDIANA